MKLEAPSPEPSDFTQEFAFFLAHSNEKRVTLEHLSKLIKERGHESVLDIGAGDGSLAIPLSRLVKTYKAIEAEGTYVRKLSQAGIDVVEGSYPLPIEGVFDLVLMSHVISYRRNEDGTRSDRARELIKFAWEHVKPQGSLVIITHRGIRGPWEELLDLIGWHARREEALAEMVGILEDLGQLRKSQIVSEVSCTSEEEMLRALSFVAAYGRENARNEFLEHKDVIIDAIRERREGSLYRFPFSHPMLETIKPKS